MQQLFKKYRYPLLSLLIILLTAFSAINTAYALAGDAAKANKHFIWAVEGKQNTVFLMGSIHVLKQNSYPLPQAIEKAYDCCRRVVFETDIDRMSSPESMAMMMKSAQYSGRQTLSRSISDHTYGLIREKLSETGLPIENFERFKPWFIALSIVAGEIQRLGYDPSLGIDQYFYRKAVTDRKELLFLESNESQINLMAGLNSFQQEDFLEVALKGVDVIESLAADMVNAWQAGDTKKLDTIIRMDYEGNPEILDRFITQRNRRWVTQIENLLNHHDDVLIIVGSGHLVGRDSVIDLLKKKGYNVNQR